MSRLVDGNGAIEIASDFVFAEFHPPEKMKWARRKLLRPMGEAGPTS